MLLEKAEYQGISSWSNSRKHPNLLVIGTSPNVEEEAFLNICSLQTYPQGKNSSHLKRIGVTRSPARLSSLDWCPFGEDSSFPFGIIAGGMEDGSISLWDASSIINQGTEESVIGCQNIGNIHSGKAVSSLEFNPYKPSLLASGGSEVFIQNLDKNLKNPDVFRPGVPNHHQDSHITCVRWNRSVQHILASASQNGMTVVWDLKTNKPIFKFTDPNLSFESGYYNESEQTSERPPQKIRLSWHPENATQLVVTCDDERFPFLNIWDLRQPNSPISSLSGGHDREIIDVAWNPLDPGLILSSGKDRLISSWHYKIGESIGSRSVESAITQLSWSPLLPALFSASSEDGNVSIYSHHDSVNQELPTPITKQKAALLAPRWLTRRVGCAFGFGGKLVTFGQKQGAKVHLLHVGYAPSLAEESKEFDSQLTTTSSLEPLCENRIKKLHATQAERIEWELLRAFSVNKKGALLATLGFDSNKIIKEAEQYTGKKMVSKETDSSVSSAMTSEFEESLSLENAEAFFDNLGKQEVKEKKERKGSATAELGGNQGYIEQISRNTNWNEGIEKIIKQNLLIGNLEGAVECALKAGRTTEAFLLASAGGDALFERTKSRFFENHKDSYIKQTMRSIVEHKVEDIIDSKRLGDWKETLAYCLTYSSEAESKKLAEQIAQLLFEKRKDIDSAIIAYMISNNFHKLMQLWTNRLITSLKKCQGRNKIKFIQPFFEKILIYKTSAKSFEGDALMDTIFGEYGLFLAAHRMPDTALKYLELCDHNSDYIKRIKDRIVHSVPRLLKHNFQDKFPYELENVAIKMSIYRTQTLPVTRDPHGVPRGMVEGGIYRGGGGGSGGVKSEMNYSQGGAGVTGPRNILMGPRPRIGGMGPRVGGMGVGPGTLGGAGTHGHTGDATHASHAAHTAQMTAPPRPRGMGVNANRPRMMHPQQHAEEASRPPITNTNRGMAYTPGDQSNLSNVSGHSPGAPDTQHGDKPAMFNPANTYPTTQNAPPPGRMLPPPSGNIRPPPIGFGTRPTILDPPDHHVIPPPSKPSFVAPPAMGGVGFRPPVTRPPPIGGPGGAPPPRGIMTEANFGIKGGKPATLNREISGADISEVPPQYTELSQFFVAECELISQVDNNQKKRKVLEQGMSLLFKRLAEGSLDTNCIQMLSQILKAINGNNYQLAFKLHSDLAEVAWTNNKEWLQVLKRIIQFKAQRK